MWIDPKDPLRIIEGNDGGATVSFNGGASWSSLYNQPTAEYYHITADTTTGMVNSRRSISPILTRRLSGRPCCDGTRR